jgi:hypothetical protein
MMKPICLITILVAAACSDDKPRMPGEMPVDPDTAPVASVDRFSDSFGHLFKRSAPIFDPANVQPKLPAPNAPIDFDAMFTVRGVGPQGERVAYYSLDILPRTPSTGYVLLRAGAPVTGQLEIIDGLPGDPGYNDFVRVTEISVDDDYVANTLTSADEVRAAIAAGEVTAKPTTRIANWAVVPNGSKAALKFRGKTVTGNRAWVRGQVANFLRFEEDLAARSDGSVPVAEIIVMFDNNMDPSAGFAVDADGITRNAINRVATDPGYSSLWNHSVGNKANFASIVDFQTAFDNIMAPNVGVDVNCPEVR